MKERTTTAAITTLHASRSIDASQYSSPQIPGGFIPHIVTEDYDEGTRSFSEFDASVIVDELRRVDLDDNQASLSDLNSSSENSSFADDSSNAVRCRRIIAGLWLIAVSPSKELLAHPESTDERGSESYEEVYYTPVLSPSSFSDTFRKFIYQLSHASLTFALQACASPASTASPRTPATEDIPFP